MKHVDTHDFEYDDEYIGTGTFPKRPDAPKKEKTDRTFPCFSRRLS